MSNPKHGKDRGINEKCRRDVLSGNGSALTRSQMHGAVCVSVCVYEFTSNL